MKNFLLLLVFPLFATQFEGIWEDCENRRPFFMSFFLPYNPLILSYDPSEKTKEECLAFWPKCSFFYAHELPKKVCDLLWIDNKGAELSILENEKELLQKATIVYTSTKNSSFKDLRSFLESFGFTLAAHWYLEEGNAIFVKRDIFAAAMRTLNYVQNPKTISTPGRYSLSRFFHAAPQKKRQHAMDPIDFIYMINLDERPEKFALCESELAPYGISPYRFSAVNGWKLPASAFKELGVRIFSRPELLMGSIYKEIDGIAYLSNEPMRQNGEAYFLLGMSRGSIGIVLSHLSVLHDAYESGFNTIWVMEDDIEVIASPWKIPDLLALLDKIDPEWDILFTDIDTKDRFHHRVPCRALAARPNFHMESLDFYVNRAYKINQELSRCSMRYGAYSMIVRRSGMKKILDYYQSYGIFAPYDMDYWLIPDLRMYRVNQDLVSTRVGAPTDNHMPGYREKDEPEP